MSRFDRHRPIRLFAVALVALAIASASPTSLLAQGQGLESEQAIDTIVGSDVKTEEKAVSAETDRLLAAIENTIDNASEVRRKFSLDTVEIIFLPELADGTRPDIETAMTEHKAAIEELRQSIEGSAMFYHAIDSRDVLLRDIIALEFDDENGVTIFVAGTAPAE